MTYAAAKIRPQRAPSHIRAAVCVSEIGISLEADWGAMREGSEDGRTNGKKHGGTDRVRETSRGGGKKTGGG
ncbi:hypothetical protein EYF80_061091 [Liparis tanakae]|uniref:Uncharacterized protein n=1 Tax=Liparis tanakae TaxID=230148 RepID=A0A4Z2EJF2_9TELE|nr:hypothetical protein EYF80_061091 [Liparis tanakae]